ncbi:sporulation integral membrane protein YtvI [Gracilibacillus dipsosauri]|uniref:Sporulation integral membrane protein YtvI n=1 Tax=Gracilibacillus dipsosauri TaxID=178340 RepID=A0A317L5Y1_9BACI|nr:sporulation integral membrane protein YtvI [Gracilibacillus dipsosauri]PWU69179.1 sporulation integral membrane protein YtvI [Gracilibacillus dipsosauri]
MAKLNAKMLYRIGLFIFGLGLTVYIFYFLFQYLFPLLLACCFSLLLYPIIKLISDKTTISHLWACLFVIFFTIAFIIFLLVFVVFEVIEGVIYLAKWLPEPFHAFLIDFTAAVNSFLLPYIQKIGAYLDNLSPEQSALMKEQLDEISISFADQIANFLENFLSWLGLQLAALPGTITIIIFSLLCTFFICKDWERFYHYVSKKVSSDLLSVPFNIYQQLKVTLVKYITAQIILVSISWVTIFIGLLLLKVKHAFTISIIVAIMDVLPILGTGLIFIPWILFLFVSGNSWLGFCVLSLFGFVMIQRQVLEPKLISQAIGIHPMLTILAIYLGFQLFGINGLWIAPAFLFFMKACYHAGLFSMILTYIQKGKFG